MKGRTDGICPPCDQTETTNHLFFQCPIARLVWAIIREALQWDECSNLLWGFWSGLSYKGSNKLRECFGDVALVFPADTLFCYNVGLNAFLSKKTITPNWVSVTVEDENIPLSSFAVLPQFFSFLLLPPGHLSPSKAGYNSPYP